MKRFFFFICALAASYAVLEISSLALYRLMFGKPFSFQEVESEQTALATELGKLHDSMKTHDTAGQFVNYTLHPFLGFVKNIDAAESQSPLLTKYGFFSEEDPITASADPGVAIVGVVGGSVSENLFNHESCRKILHRQLDALPVFKGRRVIITSLGAQAYKQPQQFFSVAYYLFEGGRLDMLINLDGYNEANMYRVNVGKKVYPLYPAWWPDFFPSDLDSTGLVALGNIMMWKNYRSDAMSLLGQFRFSVTAQTLWKLADRYLEIRALEYTKEMGKARNNNLPYFLSGPDIAKKTSKDMDNFSLHQWIEGSIQLQHLAQANHFSYFHFLQPNQYMPGAKQLSDEEKANAYLPDSDMAHVTAAVYPSFAASITSLRAQGVDAYDLTGIYKNTKGTIYIDSCCHMNTIGYDMIAEVIGKHITEDMQKTRH